jgi:chromosome segregation ATPase
MSDLTEIVTGALDRLDERLVHAEALLVTLETQLSRAELLASSGAVDTPQPITLSLMPILGRVSTQMQALNDLSTTILDGLQTLDEELSAAPEQVDSELEELNEDVANFEAEILERVERLGDAYESAVTTIESHLAEKLSSLSERVDTLLTSLDGSVEGVQSTLADAVEKIDSIRESGLGAAADFVEHVDGQIGQIVDGFDDIEKVVEPIMPIITMLEGVA